MIENLLHENVVLSEDEAFELRKRGTSIPEDRNVAIITYLGVDGPESNVVHLLVRFSEDYIPVLEIIQKVFGADSSILLTFGYGNSPTDLLPGYRLLSTVVLGESLRFPKGVLRMKAQEFAHAISRGRALRK